MKRTGGPQPTATLRRLLYSQHLSCTRFFFFAMIPVMASEIRVRAIPKPSADNPLGCAEQPRLQRED